MTIREAIDILEKELGCKNKSCDGLCTECEFWNEDKKARDALEVALDVLELEDWLTQSK